MARIHRFLSAVEPIDHCPGTLVAAGMDQSPPQYRATVQSFLPLFQAVAALAAGVVSGVLSDRFGLTLTLEGLLVVGMVSGTCLLLLARARYNQDHATAGPGGVGYRAGLEPLPDRAPADRFHPGIHTLAPFTAAELHSGARRRFR
jgi:hypothetical protein